MKWGWFVLLTVFLFYVFVSILHLHQDPDLWWHLASGRWIWAARRVPTVDVFSWTAKGTAWVDSYWLYDAAIFGIFRCAGLNGVLLIHALAVVLLFAWNGRRLLEDHAHWTLSLAALTLLFMGGAPGGYWGAQASLLSLLFTVVLLKQLEPWDAREWKTALWSWLFWFPLWANLHRGFVIGILIAAVYVSFGLPKQLRTRGRIWLFLCMASTFLTPYGARLFKMIWMDFFLSSEKVMGWTPPDLIHSKIFLFSAFLFWTTEIIVWRRREQNIGRTALGALLMLGGIRSVVFIPYFLFFALPLLARRLTPLAPVLFYRRGKHILETVLMGTALAVLVTLISKTHPALGVQTEVFPVQAFDLIHSENLQGRPYNDYHFGGYWIWALAGAPPVFIDGRYPAVEGYRPLLLEVLGAMANPRAWAVFLDRYHIDYALMKYYPGTPFPSLFERIFPPAQWALVYWDDAAVLYVKRGKRNQAAIDRLEFRDVFPDSTPASFAARFQRLTASGRAELMRELLRNVREHPTSRRAAAFLQLSRRLAPAG